MRELDYTLRSWRQNEKNEKWKPKEFFPDQQRSSTQVAPGRKKLREFHILLLVSRRPTKVKNLVINNNWVVCIRKCRGEAVHVIPMTSLGDSVFDWLWRRAPRSMLTCRFVVR